MERLCLDEIRISESTSASRAITYSLFSLLMSSPHDMNQKDKLIDIQTLPLPFDFDLESTINEFCAEEQSALKTQYSVLFEVGDTGPPASIREDLFMMQPAKLREDLVRFYEYFGYQLNDEFQWQMDHLSIQLEFMHFLIVGESQVEKDKLSFQLGQLDFSKKHLMNWVPKLVETIKVLSSDDIYSKIGIKLESFLTHDLQWQEETINQKENSGG
ncbi:MAG: molecular chaperone TorD family protein [Gammaproteobacteria bacterium]|nr:molecular chaperone TorD family protein [Gammaproteobacteria bacterium]